MSAFIAFVVILYSTSLHAQNGSLPDIIKLNIEELKKVPDKAPCGIPCIGGKSSHGGFVCGPCCTYSASDFMGEKANEYEELIVDYYEQISIDTMLQFYDFVGKSNELLIDILENHKRYFMHNRINSKPNKVQYKIKYMPYKYQVIFLISDGAIDSIIRR